MSNVNENKKSDFKLIKHFIKDLSFENPQSINELKADRMFKIASLNIKL